MPVTGLRKAPSEAVSRQFVISQLAPASRLRGDAATTAYPDGRGHRHPDDDGNERPADQSDESCGQDGLRAGSGWRAGVWG